MATISRKLTAIVTADTTGFDRGMRNVARTSKGTSKVVIGSAVAIGAAVVGIGFAALKAAASFETAVAEISTIAGVSEKGMGKIRDDLLALSVEFGSTAKDNAKGFYQTISSGVTDTAEAMTVMRRANELAIAGLTNQETAVNLLTATMNAYGFSAAKAGDINDSLFTTVRLGRLRIEELSAALGRVMPIAANVGIKFDELNAAVATVTLGGLRADAAITGLRSLINSLINPAEGAAKALEEAGVSFGIGALRAKGLKGIMEELGQALKDPNTNIAKLIPNIRALPAALLLAKDGASKFTQVLSEYADKAGSADAAMKKLNSTMERRFKRAVAESKKELIELGDTLKGPATEGLNLWTWTLKTVSKSVKGYGMLADALRVSVLNNSDAFETLSKTSENATKSLGTTELQRNIKATLEKAHALDAANRGYAIYKKSLDDVKAKEAALAAETRAAAGRLAEWSASLLKANESTKKVLKERTTAFRAHFAELTSLQAKRKSELESAASSERTAFQNLVSLQEQGAEARFARKQRKADPAQAAKQAFAEAERLTKAAAGFEAAGKGGVAGDQRRRAKSILEGIERDAISIETSMTSKIARIRQDQERLKEQFSKARTGKQRSQLKAEFKANRAELSASQKAIESAKANEAKTVAALTTAQTTAENLAQAGLTKTTEKRKTAEMALTDIIAKVTEFKEKSAGLKIDIKTETSEERLQRLIALTNTLIAKQAALQTKIAAAQPATAATTSTGTQVMSSAAIGRDKSASKFEAGLALTAPGAGAAAGPVTLNFNFSETISREEIREKVVPEIERVLDRNQTKREKAPA